MRKVIHSVPAPEGPTGAESWLDLDTIATVDLSSEDPHHPFEQALTPGTSRGWRASAAGPQSICLRFDVPQDIHRVRIEIVEEQMERAQEMVLYATSTTMPRKELLRQQWVFSPDGSTSEIEVYTFQLGNVTLLELEIDPGRHDKQVFASLRSIQIG